MNIKVYICVIQSDDSATESIVFSDTDKSAVLSLIQAQLVEDESCVFDQLQGLEDDYQFECFEDYADQFQALSEIAPPLEVLKKHAETFYGMPLLWIEKTFSCDEGDKS